MMTNTFSETTALDVTALSDTELSALVAAGQVELAAREKRRREETIAKIRALAGEAGLSVAIEGARGRPGGRGSKKREVQVSQALGNSREVPPDPLYRPLGG